MGKNKFTGKDVLIKAKQILENNQLKKRDNPCHLSCPFCACSAAKGVLDKKHKTETRVEEIIWTATTGRVREMPGDAPLAEARDSLLSIGADVDNLYSKSEAIGYIDMALKSIKGRKT